ncbi:hypothetical protein DPMN_059655 [Dreissena polymorpha]|uniref:Uncharacterized protein n=2 Tax=Dreissena polymorpha TaxID=45954 RepID=A0A9D4C3W3_DREPO|nr:hypothetical protein DPMN_059655 [Dreissena polymorpha]
MVRKTNESDQSMEDDMELAAEMSHFHDNVDYMEEKLTAQAQARAHERRKGSAKGWTSTYGGKFRTPKQTPNKDLGKMLKVIKSEMLVEQDTSHDDTMQDTDLEDDIFGLNIKADEIFDIGTGVFSEKLIKALTSAALVTTVLEKVALLTNTRLTQEDGRYMLCGKLEDLLAAKQLVIKTIEGSESDAEQEMPSSPDRKSGRSAKKPKNSTVEETSKATHKGKEKSKKEAVVAKKRTPGRPKKKADSFPYSEIEEIIEASKKTDKGKKGPTRPPKKLPLPKTLKSKEPIQEAATPTTPGRYGTRGVKRDYLEMSRGVVVVKQEVISDDELGEGSEEDEEEVEEEMTPRRRKSGAQAGAKRGRPRKQAVEDEEEEESVESLDDSEQEELDQFSDNQDEGGDEDRDIENEELPVVENVTSEKSNSDSTVPK